MTGQAIIVQGDALRLPLPDGSVDLIVTSPPYFALRAYDAGPGQLGSEPTPHAYLEALWAATAEMVRVLKPTGSIFVDLGDKYGGFQSQPGTKSGLPGIGKVYREQPYTQEATARGRQGKIPGTQAKSLLLLPERYRVGCVDRLNLIARAVIVWDKPNGLPESVTDRVRRSHEDWVHLTKQPRYYAATDEVREPATTTVTPGGATRYLRPGETPSSLVQTRAANGNPHRRDTGQPLGEYNPLGKLPGSVWTIPSEPLRLPDHLDVQHYAAFPSEWPRRLILGWSPPGICLDCGQGRFPVTQPTGEEGRHPGGRTRYDKPTYTGLADATLRPRTILGYACACTPHTNHPGSGESSQHSRHGPNVPNSYDPKGAGWGGKQNLAARPKVGPWREYHLDGWTPPPTRPAAVLDPFSGTGTTPMVARALGRIGIGVDLSIPYCRAARWRVHHDAGKAISRTWTERQGSLL